MGEVTNFVTFLVSKWEHMKCDQFASERYRSVTVLQEEGELEDGPDSPVDGFDVIRSELT